MSSTAFSAALVVEPRPSKLLRGLLVMACVAAVAAATTLPAAALVAAVLLLAPAVWHEWRALQRPMSLYWRADGDWCDLATGSILCLDRATFVSRWLVVLVLRDADGVHRIPLLPDSLTRTQWRRLRARLRLEGAG